MAAEKRQHELTLFLPEANLVVNHLHPHYEPEDDVVGVRSRYARKFGVTQR